MNTRYPLLHLAAADFIVRAAYQMGKTPLLPLFAASLGASGPSIGLIFSISTFTGMVIKPLVGVLSDHWGRRVWLWVGTALFAIIPLLYGLVHTPRQLFGLRLVHGLATAIYGPVTLAFVSEHASTDRAEKIGFFGIARSAGYIVGPATAGWLLTFVDPVSVFTIIGLVSIVAFIPIACLPKTEHKVPHPNLRQHLVKALSAGLHTGFIWLAGILEATVFTAIYAIKAFLPIYALDNNHGVALAGAFFTVQEASHLIFRPLGGRLGDRLGPAVPIAIGMVLLAISLTMFDTYCNSVWLFAPAIVIGSSQALIFPSTLSLVADRVGPTHIGVGMGLVGALRNAGKVVGPILGGWLVHWLDFSGMFLVMALLLLGASPIAGLIIGQSQWKKEHPRTHEAGDM